MRYLFIFIYNIGNIFGLLNLLVISELNDLTVNSGTTHDHATKITDHNSKKILFYFSCIHGWLFTPLIRQPRFLVISLGSIDECG